MFRGLIDRCSDIRRRHAPGGDGGSPGLPRRDGRRRVAEARTRPAPEALERRALMAMADDPTGTHEEGGGGGGNGTPSIAVLSVLDRDAVVINGLSRATHARASRTRYPRKPSMIRPPIGSDARGARTDPARDPALTSIDDMTVSFPHKLRKSLQS